MFMPERIGFVGVGRMGANLARRLKDCGREIPAVYDLNAAAAQALAAELGARPASTLAEVTAAAEVIITVVTDDRAMKAVFREGLLAATCRQYRRMVTSGLGELDKSGIAELTFKGRGLAKQT